MTAESASKDKPSLRTRIIVWNLRIIVGAVFILSGFAKADDIYGFIFKIE